MPELPWDASAALAGLSVARARWRAAHHGHLDIGIDGFPARQRLDAVVRDLSAALFPQRLGEAHGAADEDGYVAGVLARGLRALFDEVRLELRYWQVDRGAESDAVDDRATAILRAFTATLPEVRSLIDGDVEAAFRSDPAARSVDEILICYPSALAMIHHRIAHRLYALGAPLVARIIAELAHARTGIDIHPGATIGPSFFLDHGTGVVIGETAVIGARVRLYQAVTLGARRLDVEDADGARQSLPRHPIIADDVVIYAGATILGRITIGRGSTIGGNVWIVDDVPPHSLVTQGEVRLRISQEPADAGG